MLNGASACHLTVAELLEVVTETSKIKDSRKAFVCSCTCVVHPAASADRVASFIVASVEPRVNGIACGCCCDGTDAIGERLRLAGAGAVPGAPIPDDDGVAIIVLSLKEG